MAVDGSMAGSNTWAAANAYITTDPLDGSDTGASASAYITTDVAIDILCVAIGAHIVDW